MHALSIPKQKLPPGCFLPPASDFPVCLPLPRVIPPGGSQSGGAPSFCGGNSGIPCPTTGFLGVISAPPGPDLRPGLFGLADLRPQGYVLAGTRIHFEANAAVDLFTDLGAISSCLVSTLGPALQAPQISFDTPLIGTPRIKIDGTVGFDRSSINDVQGDLMNQSAACGVTLDSPSIVIVSTPGIPVGPGQTPVQPPTPGLLSSLGLGTANPINLPVFGAVGIGAIILIAGIAIFAITRR